MPARVLQLQQLVGNRAVSSYLRKGIQLKAAEAGAVSRNDESASGPSSWGIRVETTDEQRADAGAVTADARAGASIIQRSVSVTLNKSTHPPTISKVTAGSRPSTGKSHGQGSHTTAWVTFVDMVRLRVEGKTYAQAGISLEECYDELCEYLPGDDVKSLTYTYAKQEAGTAIRLLKMDKGNDSGTKALLVDAIEKLLSMRNKMPYSSTPAGNKSVTNESNHSILFNWERAVRRGTDITTHRNYPFRYQVFWQMFDYQPTFGADDELIENIVRQHINSMQATYEELFRDDHFKHEEAAQYLRTNATFWNWFTERIEGARKSKAEKKLRLKELAKLIKDTQWA